MKTSDTADIVPIYALHALKILTHSIFTITFRERNDCYTNFTGEETESERLNNLLQILELLGGRAVT